MIRPDDRTPQRPPARVLVISASIGGGHVAAGRALERAFLEAGVDVQHVDMLDYTNAPFRQVYRQTYFDLVRTAPSLVDWLGKRLDRTASEVKTRQERLRAQFVRLVSFRLPRLIRQYRPDILVHTHFLPPEILSTLGSRHALPQAEVLTDFAAHALWLQPNIGRYFVAMPEMAVHLRSAGVDEERIVVSGIPIDPRFERPVSRAVARERLQIPKDRETLLVMANGMDRRTVSAVLAQLKELRYPALAVVVCGRSTSFITDVQRDVSDHPGPLQFRVLGYTTEIPAYMSASDLLVGKPGGLTTSEALASGLPFAVVQPYPIQEEANANFLLEHGAGVRIDPVSVLGHKVRVLLEDPERLKRMRSAALALGRPGAARSIVRSLLDRPL